MDAFDKERNNEDMEPEEKKNDLCETNIVEPNENDARLIELGYWVLDQFIVQSNRTKTNIYYYIGKTLEILSSFKKKGCLLYNQTTVLFKDVVTVLPA